MTNGKKLEPRLVTFLEQQRARATADGGPAAAVDDVPVKVTVSHFEPLTIEEAGYQGLEARKTTLESFGESVKTNLDPILSRLKTLKNAPELSIHSITNAVTAKLTPRQMNDIAEIDEVGLIRLEALEPVTCMNESVKVIEVPEAEEDFQATGSGIKVAVLDSGIDKTHPALFARVVDEVSTVGEPVDVAGNHGTHVAGTIASNDPVYRGIAPDAELINIKVLTATGSGTPAGVIRGLEEAVLRGARVANLSLGWSEIAHGWICDDADCILCRAADNAVRLGVTLVVAAGNEGSSGGVAPFAIRHPGAARRVITVGAVDKAKALTTFSSTGPSSGRLSTGSPVRLTKPDLSAPGAQITSTVTGGQFAAMSGTSMAAPHVAGLVALAFQRNPNLQPLMVKKLMEGSSEHLAYGPDQVGYGLANAYGTLMAVGIGGAAPLALEATA